MDKSIAVKRLHKILGKGFGYRVNPKAATREEREKAKADIKSAREEKDRLASLMEDRKREVLAGDQEYQERLSAWKAARDHWGKLSSMTHSYRITVGNSNGMFFLVKAEGDNWEEVLEKVKS